MKSETIFMFSGQGSQYYHMGRELYLNNELFRYWMQHCDKIATPLLGRSLLAEIYERHDKFSSFDNITFSSPALIAIQYSMARIVIDMGIKPDYVMGYSLGELIAAIVSGSISLSQGISFSIACAEVIKERTPSAAMLAVLASPRIIQEHPVVFRNCWLTGMNFYRNFVITGDVKSINETKEWLYNRDIATQLLPVKYGFHTEMIEGIKDDYDVLIKDMKLNSMRIPIISVLMNKKIEVMDKDYLWGVFRNPVNFDAAINRLIQKGNYRFIDVSPGGTLATFVKNIIPVGSQTAVIETLNRFGNDTKTMRSLEQLVTTTG